MGFRPWKCLACSYYPECQQPEGVCIETQRMPTPHWTNDFTAAVDIYSRTIQFSGADMNGMPQLTKLEFILEHSDYEIDNENEFMMFLNELHFAMCSMRASR